jgi:predicted RNA-binding Zn-ribbon protein involved in translation (DUF1610 family)
MSDKLTECKSCGKEVAVMAKECPHCGERHPGVSTGIGCIVAIVMVGAAFRAWAFWFGGGM